MPAYCRRMVVGWWNRSLGVVQAENLLGEEAASDRGREVVGRRGARGPFAGPPQQAGTARLTVNMVEPRRVTELLHENGEPTLSSCTRGTSSGAALELNQTPSGPDVWMPVGPGHELVWMTSR